MSGIRFSRVVSPTVRGALVTVLVAAVLEVVSYTVLSAPNPHPLLLVAVVYSTLIAGVRGGTYSAAVMVIYTVYYLSPTRLPGGLVETDVRRIVVLLVASPILIAVVASLKRRSETAFRDKIARMEAEKELAVARAQRTMLEESNDRLRETVRARTAELAQTVAQLRTTNERLTRLDAARTEFLALVAHQVRAPLTNIRCATEELLDDAAATGRSTAADARLLALISGEVDALDRLVKLMLDATRVDSASLLLQREATPIRPLLSEAVERVASLAKGRSFRISDVAGLPLVVADRERILDVLVNILENAHKYSTPTGTVHLEASAVAPDEVRVSVCDQGPGIATQDLAHIFDKFYRGQRAGSAYGHGLGLFICRRLVERQGGRIWAANQPTGGAVVSFTLPVVEAAMR
jgi:K+-sensing histidine kinase KdpD